ncbi:MAG: UDP-N-acetylmuramoyl-L-alanyl-D-glutamate--2,6-diaminopimelate ligase [Pseudomonadota bacterium]
MSRRLSELLSAATPPGGYHPVAGFPDLEIRHITGDSREVRPGSLFLAMPGISSDGRDYIADAINRGATAIFCEAPAPELAMTAVPVIEVEDLASLRGVIASRFFGEPSTAMTVIAVTGTNGKTSCSHFIAQAINLAGRHCGVVGTLGFGVPPSLRNPGLTTPDAIQLQSILATLQNEGTDSVCMEASSHGLAQGRVTGTKVDIAVLTNLTRDHLDYHRSFSDYKAAKRILFELPGLRSVILNLDDEFGRELAVGLSGDVRILTYSQKDGAADVYCDSVVFREDGFDLEVVSPWGAEAVSSPLLGEFNVANLLATLCVLGLLGTEFPQACRIAGSLPTVRGRMEACREPGFPVVVIDYAHTPDALEKALVSLRPHTRGELWCVVGCGGDRDSGKRPLMGQVASRNADRAVFTNDNPRTEDPEAIIGEMLKGVEDRQRVQVLPDRRRAIRTALLGGGEHDVVLVAGKGHEDYQEISGIRYPFSDHGEVEQIFAEGRTSGGV